MGGPGKKTYTHNEFGGGNRTSLYVPMSEVEQEALERMALSGELRVHVVDWGWHDKPAVVFGDARIKLTWRMDFTKPELPMDVYYFDLELWWKDWLLDRSRKSIEYGGKPMAIAAGIFIDLEWHIAIQVMDPQLVKDVTGAYGLTSRLIDRDTGELTETGNMALNSKQKGRIHMLREGEKYVRDLDADRSAKAKAKQDGKGPR